MFEGEPLSYWENYEDGEEIVYPTDDDDYLRDEIEAIIERYRTTDGDFPEGKVAYHKDFSNKMFQLAKLMMTYKGSCDLGVLAAYCMQNMQDEEAWETSPKLVDVNNRTGIFDTD